MQTMNIQTSSATDRFGASLSDSAGERLNSVSMSNDFNDYNRIQLPFSIESTFSNTPNKKSENLVYP